MLEPIYNGVNDRVGQIEAGVQTDFALDVAAGLPEVIYTSEGNAYLHLAGVIVAESGSGEVRYLLSDGLGSVRQAVDETGAVVSYHEFDPYGNPVQGGGEPYGYTGEWWEDEVDLLHLRARWYAPGTGTFLSVDPVESEPPYAYVRGRVVNWVDPSGRQSPGDSDLPPLGEVTPEPTPNLSNPVEPYGLPTRIQGTLPTQTPQPAWPHCLPPLGSNAPVPPNCLPPPPPPSPPDPCRLYPGDGKWCDIIIYYPGGVPKKLPEDRIGLPQSWLGEKAVTGLSVIADGAEIIATITTVAGIPDAVAVGDILLAAAGSSFGNQTYYGRSRPDAPTMLVVGQDVFPAVIDAGIPLVPRVIGGVGGLAGQPQIAAGGAAVGFFC